MRVFDVVNVLHMACQRLHVATLTVSDDRGADEAIHRRNGYDFDGCRLRVELSRGGRGRDGGGRRRSRSRSRRCRRSRSSAAVYASKKSRSRSRSPAARPKSRPRPKPKSRESLRSLTVSTSKVAGTALL